MTAINSPADEEYPASARDHEPAGAVTRRIQRTISPAAALEPLEETRSEASELGDHGQDNVCGAAPTLAQYVAERRSRRR